MSLERPAAEAAKYGQAGSEAANRAAQSLGNGRRASDVLREIANTWPDERISLGDFIDMFGDRAHGLLMLTLALPNLVPIYLPGLSAITGLPIATVALQMVLGRKHPWLPGFLRRRSIAVADLRRVVERAEPWLKPVERVLRPRAPVLAQGALVRVMAAVCLLLALLLSLPIPFTNMPLAAPIAIFALGVIEHDGAAVGVAAAASAAALAFVGTAGWALSASALAVIGP